MPLSFLTSYTAAEKSIIRVSTSVSQIEFISSGAWVRWGQGIFESCFHSRMTEGNNRVWGFETDRRSDLESFHVQK